MTDTLVDQTVKVFVCPVCGSPHFGSFVRPGDADENWTYACHGNEWQHKEGCGWQGPAEQCFQTMTRQERRLFEINSGSDEFFSRLNRMGHAATT